MKKILLILISVLFLLIPFVHAVITPAPIAFFSLNETSGTTLNDNSGNGHTGFYSAAQTVQTGCPVGNCLSCTGTNYALTNANFGISGNHARTFSFWSNSTGNSAGWFTTVALGSASGNSLFELAVSSWNTFYLNGWSDDWDSAIGPLPKWQYYTLTFDGSILKLYVNGTIFATSGAKTFATANVVLGICARADLGDKNVGSIDEVSVFDYALNDSQVQELNFTKGNPYATYSPPAPPNTSVIIFGLSNLGTSLAGDSMQFNATIDALGNDGFMNFNFMNFVFGNYSYNPFTMYPLNFTDGNFTSYMHSTIGETMDFTINYIKPIGATNYTLIFGYLDSTGEHNLTFSDFCPNAYSDKVILDIEQNENTFHTLWINCYNGTYTNIYYYHNDYRYPTETVMQWKDISGNLICTQDFAHIGNCNNHTDSISNFISYASNVQNQISYQKNATGYYCYSVWANSSLSNFNVSSESCFTISSINISSSMLNNYLTESNVNYTKMLNYTINYSCSSFYQTSISKYVDGFFGSIDAFSCDNAAHSFLGHYTPSSEGYFNISININNSDIYSPLFNKTFISVINPPSITTNMESNASSFTLLANYAVNITSAKTQNMTLTDTCSNSIANTSMGNTWNFMTAYNITACSFGTKYVNISACNIFNDCMNKSYSYSSLGRIIVYAFSSVNGVPINNFEILLNGTYLGSTTNGSIFIDNLAASAYNISVTGGFYENKFNIVSLIAKTMNSTSFSLHDFNSVLLTFIDESNGLSVSNVSFGIISPTYSANYSTANGTFYAASMSPNFYTIRYVANGYSQRYFYFNLVNGSYSNYTLSLLANDSTYLVTATLYDEANHLVEGGFIKVLKYDITSNAYVLKEIAATNFEGTTLLHLIPNSEYYEFIIEYPFGLVKKMTTGTLIYTNALTFQIYIGSKAASKFLDSQKITYMLYFNNATNDVSYTYNDDNSMIAGGCMDLYSMKTGSKDLINSSCINASTATLLMPIDNSSSNTFIVDASILYPDGTKYHIDELTKEFEYKNSVGKIGLFIVLLLTIVCVFMFRWDRTIALIITPLPLLIGSVFEWVNFSTGICVCLEIVAIIIAFTLSRKF